MRYQRINDPLSTLLADMFSNNIAGMTGGDMTETIPAVNVATEEDRYILEIAIPGLEKEDIDVKIEKDDFIISAEREKESGTYESREFDYSVFRKTFSLPEDVDRDKIEANYEAGILKIELPRIAEDKLELVKKIEIK